MHEHHNHDHHEHGACCGHQHSEKDCNEGCCQEHQIILTEQEGKFLLDMAATPFLPVVRFVMQISTSHHNQSVALAPVYLTEKNETMAQVKETAEIIANLAQYGLLDIDYDIPLQNFDYAVFEQSVIFAYFLQTIEDGKAQQHFIYDMGIMEQGSISVTALGQEAIDQIGG